MARNEIRELDSEGDSKPLKGFEQVSNIIGWEVKMYFCFSLRKELERNKAEGSDTCQESLC